MSSTSIRSAAAVAAFALSAVTAAACGTSHQTIPTAAPPWSSTQAAAAPTSGTPTRPGAWSTTGVDGRDPDAVLAAVAAVVCTYAPDTDGSAAAAFTRAAGLMTPQYVREVGPTAAGLARVTGATWAQWSAEHDVVAATAAVTPDDHPADTATAHARVVAVTQIVEPGPGGASAPASPFPLVLYMIATRETPAQGWQVSMIAPR